MQYSIVSKHNVNFDDRIDAEYFEPSYLNTESKLVANHAKSLQAFAKITASAFYPSATELYIEGDVPFMRCVDTIDYPVISSLQADSFARLPESFLDENKNVKRVSDGDIVVTKVGTPCFSSIIDGLGKVALSRTVAGLFNINNIDPYYLTVFLRSKFGFDQLYRERELTIQYQLTLERIGRILIYKPTSQELENLIASAFRESHNQKIVSISQYDQAEKYLLTRVNLQEWKETFKLTYINNFSKATEADRIDAEYFKPHYEEMLNAIKNNRDGFDTLGNLVTVKKSVEPGSDEYQEVGIPFVRVSNLSKFGFNTNNQQYISENLYQQLQNNQPERDEILLSKDGTPGITYHLSDNVHKFIVSSGILRLKIKNRKVLPEYLTLVLNSLLVQKQIERNAGGSIINHWRPEQVKATVIPILNIEDQKKIGQMIKTSFDARDKSDKLFELAKEAVDRAIQTNEEAALNQLRQELDHLQVDI